MAEFSLASLLRLRRLREDQAAAEVAQARSRASELAHERHRLIDQLADHGHDASGVRGIAAISIARASTAAMLGDLEALRARQLHLVTAAEEQHRIARRETRSVEKLEEKHDAAEAEGQLRAEQRVLDELAGRTRARWGVRIDENLAGTDDGADS